MFSCPIRFTARASSKKRRTSELSDGHRLVQELDGDPAADGGVLGEVDRPHPAAAEHPDDAEAADLRAEEGVRRVERGVGALAVAVERGVSAGVRARARRRMDGAAALARGASARILRLFRSLHAALGGHTTRAAPGCQIRAPRGRGDDGPCDGSAPPREIP